MKTAAHCAWAHPAAIAVLSKVFKNTLGSSSVVIFCTRIIGVVVCPEAPVLSLVPPPGGAHFSKECVTDSKSFALAWA